MNISTKNIDINIKSIKEDGTFEGYASTFNNIDLGGDMMVKGAFSKTLNERKDKIKLLWQHKQDQVIGVFDDIKEDDNGLYIKGRLALTTQLGKESYELLKMGAISDMSIGYSVVKDDYDRTKNIRLLKEVKLYEASLVTLPMNESSVITSVKSHFDELTDEEKSSVLKFIDKLKGIDEEIVEEDDDIDLEEMMKSMINNLKV